MPKSQISVVELFAGVGGFRLALEGLPAPYGAASNGYKIVWANQWEPPGSTGRQFAYQCYVQRFDPDSQNPEQHSNEDIAIALDKAERGELHIPCHTLMVAGFPCQDYSVAKPLSQAEGIEGKKGVLWWEIYRFLQMKKPRFVILENVDRMLKSPTSQRGRDFAIMLSCFALLGYSVEWRIINAADYGFPQRRRRVYLLAEINAHEWDMEDQLSQSGIISEAFPLSFDPSSASEFRIDLDPYIVSQSFGTGHKASPFSNAGLMQNGAVYTAESTPVFSGEKVLLGDILIDENLIPEEFFIDDDSLSRWQYLKGAKSEHRKNKQTGFEYKYSEGGMVFPESLDQPSRTILTGEGGKAASRFKHVVQVKSGRFRRLVPEELELLQGFPPGWTNTGMSDVKRAFCMGNALVVGIPERLGQILKARIESE
ncbi:MAG: DNA (cytosine-5-)-methyltransferase [Coriobacteriia bacterium]|nr:DNA (cytosine-5-)-methyltransferase [Coriobacteriia bacterium]